MRIPVTSAIGALVLALQLSSQATVIWSDTYDGQAAGIRPSMDYSGGAAGNDYSVIASSGVADFLVSDTVGNAVPGLALVDTGTTTADLTTLVVTMNHFAPFQVGPASATPVLRVSFDLRVDSFLASTNTQNARFILRANNTNATGSQLVIGFAYADLNDGDPATGDLALFADTQTGATSNLPPKNTTAIGLLAGTGWAPGFDFGAYNGSDATSNDTNDEFYRFTFEYNSVSGGISGSVTQLSSGASAAFPAGLALIPGITFSDTTSDDRFLLASSASNTATAYFDNLIFEAIPEPSGTLLLTSSVALLAFRRRAR